MLSDRETWEEAIKAGAVYLADLEREIETVGGLVFLESQVGSAIEAIQLRKTLNRFITGKEGTAEDVSTSWLGQLESLKRDVAKFIADCGDALVALEAADYLDV